MLVIISIVEVCQTVTDVIHAMATVKGLLFTAALAAALVPSAFVIFWSGNTITLQLKLPLRAACRYFLSLRDKKHFSAKNRIFDD
jgi:hypothetical protein